jgi:hypothetical protein
LVNFEKPTKQDPRAPFSRLNTYFYWIFYTEGSLRRVVPGWGQAVAGLPASSQFFLKFCQYFKNWQTLFRRSVFTAGLGRRPEAAHGTPAIRLLFFDYDLFRLQFVDALFFLGRNHRRRLSVADPVKELLDLLFNR